jgi:hypothetical protein
MPGTSTVPSGNIGLTTTPAPSHTPAGRRQGGKTRSGLIVGRPGQGLVAERLLAEPPQILPADVLAAKVP